EGEAMLFGEYIRLMALVEYSAEEIAAVFADFPDLEVCVYAAPSQTVIGGPPEQVDAIISRAEAEGKFARKFATKGASHTTQMDPLLGELAAELQGITPRLLTTGYFSTVHEGSYIRPGGGPIHEVDYWKKGLRHSVHFTQGIRNAVDSGYTTFLELAPNPVALMQVGLTTAAAGLHDAALIATLARKEDEVASVLAAMAQLYTYGHDLDFATLYTRAAGPGDYADIPPTRFTRKPHWLNAHFSADGSGLIPGTHVAMPDGRHVWEYAPQGPTDLAVLVKSAAVQVLPDAVLAASEQRAIPGEGARLVTTLTRHPGGASVQVHARIDESFTLVYDAVVSRSASAGSTLPAAVATGVAVSAQVADPVAVAPVDEAEILHDTLAAGAGVGGSLGKWSPDSGETVHDRLSTIVGSAMGYEPEDLPWEVPLIELGLDSLMAVRIKNRVEYDFDLPPIQLTAVRDANLYAVEKLIAYAIEHRDEVQDLHEHQKTLTPEQLAAEQAAIAAGEIPPELAEKLAAKHPEAAVAPPPTGSDIPPPPTDPAGPAATPAPAESAAAAAASVLTQQAVIDALGTDVPPREAAERITFATWAIVTGRSPGGIFNALPQIDEATAVKIAARLTERAEGAVTVEDVRSATTIEELATAVREHLESAEFDGFVRTIRAPRDGTRRVPVFVFHPAGGSTVVYEPLLKRLPPDTPMYGLERVEGSIPERAAQYVPKLMEIGGTGPFILVGWS
ncbi:MAG: acyltransferase domain-containing protein, partial [Mycobacterium sp.]